MRDLTGIERRFDKQGNEQFRGYIVDPANRNRKIRGSWTQSYAEAKGWRARALTQGAPSQPRSTPTVEEASATFLAGIKAGTIRSRKRKAYSPKTVRSYEQAFRDEINPELGRMPVEALKRSQIQRWVDGMAARMASGTARNHFHALAAMYTFLLSRYDEIEYDPAAGVILPAPAEIRERYAEPEEMVALVDALPLKLAVPFALAFWAGLRKGEIQALPVDMIDLNAGWIDVRFSLDPVEGFKGPKSGAGERVVPIFAPLRPYLEMQLAQLASASLPSSDDRPGGLLLPSLNRWGSPSYARYGTRNLGSKFINECVSHWRSVGLRPIGLHEARHSFATALVRAGYDVKLVAEWVGHAQASTTLNIYAKRRGRQDAAELAGKMNTYLIGAR